jgi:hypothetical protein
MERGFQGIRRENRLTGIKKRTMLFPWGRTPFFFIW